MSLPLQVSGQSGASILLSVARRAEQGFNTEADIASSKSVYFSQSKV